MEDKKMNGEDKPSHTYIQQQHHNEEKAKEDDKEIAMAVHEVTELVDKFVLQNQQQAKGKAGQRNARVQPTSSASGGGSRGGGGRGSPSRIQGGWATSSSAGSGSRGGASRGARRGMASSS